VGIKQAALWVWLRCFSSSLVGVHDRSAKAQAIGLPAAACSTEIDQRPDVASFDLAFIDQTTAFGSAKIAASTSPFDQDERVGREKQAIWLPGLEPQDALTVLLCKEFYDASWADTLF
jgi:hypothetical protein